jgi:uncharacterized LabA/DUF88 family protein
VDKLKFVCKFCVTFPYVKTYAYIDASNLFYGGEKSLGWRIDYKKLLKYLQNKYQASKIYYFGGVEIHNFPFDYIKQETVPLKEVEKYLVKYIKDKNGYIKEDKLLLINHHLNRVRFYLKLTEFGYQMLLKPVKTYIDSSGNIERKANCDVGMTFYMMCDHTDCGRIIFLSGDGDFLPVLKYLKENKKEVVVLARAPRTAREIKQFAGDKFLDFEYLREILRFEDNKKINSKS